MEHVFQGRGWERTYRISVFLSRGLNRRVDEFFLKVKECRYCDYVIVFDIGARNYFLRASARQGNTVFRIVSESNHCVLRENTVQRRRCRELRGKTASVMSLILCRTSDRGTATRKARRLLAEWSESDETQQACLTF